MTFTDFSLKSEILRAVAELGFESPMPIQELMIPQLLTDQDDLVGLAHTGTGKTAAFGLPIIHEIDIATRSPQALILCPTRELCIQITGELELYGKYVPGLSITAVYGGERYDRQRRALRTGTHIIVATPGRLLDLINSKSADISSIRFLVLDEADIMLNMGFKDELDAILESAPVNRRTILLSATMPRDVAHIAKNYMNDPIELSVGQRNSGTETVSHQYYAVRKFDKYPALKRLVDFHPDIYAIVFCRTRAGTQEVAEKMVRDGYNAEALHGELSQTQREHVMSKFRAGSVRLLIATDIAARGLDVDDLTHVIHYDLPTEPDAYTHRSGRTGRAGKPGVSLALITDRERKRIRWIEGVLQRKISEAQIPGKREICEQQLMQLMDRIHEVDVDADEIAQYLPLIEEKLASLSREELLQRFVSLEFNKFLSYYKDQTDLRPPEKASRRDNERYGNRSDRRDRTFKGKPNHMSFPRRSGKRSASSSDRSSDYHWLEIGIGRNESILPIDIIGLINQSTRSGDIRLGKIDIGTERSWLQVESDEIQTVETALRESSYKGRALNVRRASKSLGRAPKTA